MVVSALHKELECKVKSSIPTAEDQKQIRPTNTRVNHPGSVQMKFYSRDWFIQYIIYYWRIYDKGEGRGGLSTFFPWKGGLIRDGGNIWERGFNRGFYTVPKCTDENDERNELDSVLSRIATNRPFSHSCKQTHQLEAQVDEIQWFVWNCPPEPRPYFFMFAHWSVIRERSIAAIFRKNSSPVIKHNPFQ